MKSQYKGNSWAAYVRVLSHESKFWNFTFLSEKEFFWGVFLHTLNFLDGRLSTHRQDRTMRKPDGDTQHTPGNAAANAKKKLMSPRVAQSILRSTMKTTNGGPGSELVSQGRRITIVIYSQAFFATITLYSPLSNHAKHIFSDMAHCLGNFRPCRCVFGPDTYLPDASIPSHYTLELCPCRPG